MKTRPILFSAPMIRALQDDRKTLTRRVVKFPIKHRSIGCEIAGCELRHELELDPGLCPYGQTGDLLWVREAFLAGIEFDDDDMPKLGADGQCIDKVWYRATDDVRWFDGRSDWPSESPPWKPSIHMPRAASRITLRIASVRVERLNKISEADAKAEGCRSADYATGRECILEPEKGSYRLHFKSLWESINGAGSWEANPWVWVIEFEVINKNVDEANHD